MKVRQRLAMPYPASNPGRSPGLMQRLRQQTADIHAATEDLPLMRALLAPHALVVDYRRYLEALHEAYLATEPALYAAASPALLQSLGVRPKLPALQRDLAALGADPAAARPRPLHAAAGGEAAALGGLYVLEGATLGGRMIARRLRQRWGQRPELPFAFLEFAGERPGSEWRRFGGALEVWAVAHPWVDEAIIDGAIAVFWAMHEALAEAGG